MTADSAQANPSSGQRPANGSSNGRRADTRPGSLSGRLVKDPDLRYTKEGRPVANLRIAASDRVRDPESGEWKDTPVQFFDVTCWGQLGQHVTECLAKGDRAIFRGRWERVSYTDKEGMIHERTVLTASDAGPSLTLSEARIVRKPKEG